jgi:hypothetical protein
MNKALVVMSSNRELEKQTKHTLQNLANLGALQLMETGSADVAFVRCRALSSACDTLREYPDRDIVSSFAFAVRNPVGGKHLR